MASSITDARPSLTPRLRNGSKLTKEDLNSKVCEQWLELRGVKAALAPKSPRTPRKKQAKAANKSSSCIAGISAWFSKPAAKAGKKAARKSQSPKNAKMPQKHFQWAKVDPKVLEQLKEAKVVEPTPVATKPAAKVAEAVKAVPALKLPTADKGELCRAALKILPTTYEVETVEVCQDPEPEPDAEDSPVMITRECRTRATEVTFCLPIEEEELACVTPVRTREQSRSRQIAEQKGAVRSILAKETFGKALKVSVSTAVSTAAKDDTTVQGGLFSIIEGIQVAKKQNEQTLSKDSCEDEQRLSLASTQDSCEDLQRLSLATSNDESDEESSISGPFETPLGDLVTV
jgi:hypothetical protein